MSTIQGVRKQSTRSYTMELVIIITKEKLKKVLFYKYPVSQYEKIMVKQK